MKKLIYLFLIAATSVVLLDSCKDDEDDKGGASADIMGKWIQVGAEEDGVSDWNDWEDCEKDDITTFNADGTYQLDEGATKCDPDDPKIIDSGNWSWATKGSKLKMDGIPVDVEKLTATDMTTSMTFGTIVSKAHFKRQ